MTLDVDITSREGRIAWLEHLAYTPADEIDPDSFQYLQFVIRGMLPALKAGKKVIANVVFLWELRPPIPKKGQRRIRGRAILKTVERRLANSDETRTAIEAEVAREYGLSAGTVENIVKREKRDYFRESIKGIQKRLKAYRLSDSDIERLITVLIEDNYLVDKNILPLILELNLSQRVADDVFAILDSARVNLG